jgi:CheY-like chemotaxis protein
LVHRHLTKTSEVWLAEVLTAQVDNLSTEGRNVEQKASILIVDDNVSLCRTLSLVLGRQGYAVNTAKDGLEALVKVQESPFDMIFMDIKMPLMDGVEAYRRIKKIRPEAVVMMMTAYAVEDLVQQALEEGAYGIVYKPLDIGKVVAVIEEAKEAQEGALVLVVDDDPGTCITLKNILIKKGYEVGIAYTGEEAITMAREGLRHHLRGHEAADHHRPGDLFSHQKDQPGSGGHHDDCLPSGDVRLGGRGSAQFCLHLPLQAF